MTIYLPIAELSVNIFILLGIGAAVGFISGMFGVGGGFLTTPLLIFSGIPPAVAITTITSQIAASSFTGCLSYGRKKQIDFKLGSFLLIGGLSGTAVGVAVFQLLQSLGILDLVIALAYTVLLSSIGSIMLWESVQAAVALKKGKPIAFRKPGQHNWFHRLPLRQRFAQSRLFISVIPLIFLGFGIGFVGTTLGIGGGFIMVPAMIYLLRVPTKMVFGTSLFQITVSLSMATVLYAYSSGTVDLLLALLLTIGATAGSQLGVRTGQKLPGEHLRILLAVLIIAVALRFLVSILLPPSEIFSVVQIAGSRL